MDIDAARTEEPRTGWTYRDLPHAVDSWMYYKARAEAAEAHIAAALAIHKRVELGDYLDGSPMPDVCLACQENNVAGKKLWPCPTVRTLTEGLDQ